MSLLRPLVKPLLLLMTAIAATIGFIRAQPYQPDGLQAFLAPTDGCRRPVPCIMGIQPGLTTGGELLRILEAHPWVGRVTRRSRDQSARVRTIIWSWNGAQPDFIPEGSMGVAGIFNDVVNTILVETTVPFGELWLMLGETEDGDALFGANNHEIGHSAVYIHPHGRLVVSARLPCPFTFQTYWQANVFVSLNTVRTAPEFSSPADLLAACHRRRS